MDEPLVSSSNCMESLKDQQVLPSSSRSVQFTDQQAIPSRDGSENAKSNIITVYSFLASGLLITGLTMAALSQMERVVNFVNAHLIITTIVVTLLMTLTTSMFNSMPYHTHKPGKTLMWVLNCALCAIPLLDGSPWVLVKSAAYTFILLVILSLKSLLITSSLMDAFVSPVYIVHSLVLICTALTFLISSMENTISWLISSICLHGGFLVYSILLMCNTQRLQINARHRNFDPLFSAFVLYMNVINLYARVVVLVTKNLPVELPENPCGKIK